VPNPFVALETFESAQPNTGRARIGVKADAEAVVAREVDRQGSPPTPDACPWTGRGAKVPPQAQTAAAGEQVGPPRFQSRSKAHYLHGYMITIRSAVKSDEPTLGRFGAALMRQHHAADARRFILTDEPEHGYGRFLVSQIGDPDSLVLVAERSAAVIGYLFAGLEPLSWWDLRGPCGYVHDIYVDEGARHRGAARQLMRAAIEWARSRGMSQIVLSTQSKNEPAQRLFERIGFRRTMIEMTLDAE
jgi:ribosomal protein S18 acetylase RimI-like enzyme